MTESANNGSANGPVCWIWGAEAGRYRPCHCDDAKSGLRDKWIDNRGSGLRRSISIIAWLCIAATAVAGCSQVSGLADVVQENKFKAPDFSLPDLSLGSSDKSEQNFDLGPNGPVAADNLISANGYCPPAAAAPQAAAPPAQTPAPQQAAAAPLPDRLEPAGAAPVMQAPVLGGVALGMSECTVARRLGTPSNVSISAGPKGQRRVVLTYLEGNRPGLYSFEAGRLKQVDVTPQQAAKYDKQATKSSRRGRARSRREVERMYVQ